MIGRSLVSLLVLATVGLLQSCTAAVVEDGYHYIFLQSDRKLFAVGPAADSRVVVAEGSMQVWHVENRGDDKVVIKSAHSGLYLNLVDPTEDDVWVPTMASSTEFLWRLGRHGDGTIYIQHPDLPSNGLPPVVIGAPRSLEEDVVTMDMDETDVSQKWTFQLIRVPSNSRPESEHGCGPWRLPSDSLYIQ
ncbi:hypothetical protein B0O80DRAFT_247440 [Mortierella sp. GBAus27b]|nr:hypothetical protein B0O80DRAFT_247440 [Mortierella sp. GBAus27b]